MSKARDIASAPIAPSTVSATELGYVDGVTSAIQTQLDAKTAKSTLTTTGDIYYASAANTPARLGIGSTDQVLKVTGGVPVWATPASASPQSNSNFVATTESLTSATYTNLTTTQAITLTTGTKVMVIVGCNMSRSYNSGTTNMSYEISGATTSAASDDYSKYFKIDDQSAIGNVRIQSSYVSFRTVTAGSNTFTAKFKSNGGQADIGNRTIAVIDLGS
jgi:hypothetical protein